VEGFDARNFASDGLDRMSCQYNIKDPVAEAQQEFVGIVAGDLDLKPRIVPADRRQYGRQQEGRVVVRRANPHQTRRFRSLDVCKGFVIRSEDTICVYEQGFPNLRNRNGLSGSLEQTLSDDVFKPLYLETHR